MRFTSSLIPLRRFCEPPNRKLVGFGQGADSAQSDASGCADEDCGQVLRGRGEGGVVCEDGRVEDHV